MTYFKRPAFRGKYEANEPVWHISSVEGLSRNYYGVLTALCGYEFNNILEECTISNAVKSPPFKKPGENGRLCYRCMREQEKQTSTAQQATSYSVCMKPR